jgi:hypothetical protein
VSLLGCLRGAGRRRVVSELAGIVREPSFDDRLGAPARHHSPTPQVECGWSGEACGYRRFRAVLWLEVKRMPNAQHPFRGRRMHGRNIASRREWGIWRTPEPGYAPTLRVVPAGVTQADPLHISACRNRPKRTVSATRVSICSASVRKLTMQDLMAKRPFTTALEG